MDRRTFLGGSALGLAAGLGAPGLLLPRRAWAATSASDLRFVFVFNSGGWDTTRVFATAFDNDQVDMEADAEPATAGNVAYVDHPARPSVKGFMEANHHRMVVVNGVLVRAIAHEICTMLALTGGSSGLDPDWATILASAQGDLFTLPHLVIGGPSFPGDLVTSVARTGANGQLEALLSGDILQWNDRFVYQPGTPFENAIDRFVQRRVNARAMGSHSPIDQALAAQYSAATAAAVGLKDYRFVMDFTGGGALADQARVAVDALRLGLARSVTLGFDGGGGLGWDSHADNDETQSTLFEALFGGLAQLMELLDQTPGDAGGTLADQTVVVVMSEMGRTPQLNATLGKDHWPYTSLMLLGPGLSHDRVIGGYDSGFAGRTVDLASGELAEDQSIISAESVGAALLELAGVDPAQFVTGTEPLRGILS